MLSRGTSAVFGDMLAAGGTVGSVIVVFFGCTWISPGAVDDKLATVDEDGDGFDVREDCDDRDPDVHPDAAEVWYDGIDEDCAGDDDDDQDGDGYVLEEDCDDESAAANPGATEIWYDGIDEDCAGGDDDDQDGDGYALEDDCDDESAAANPGAAEIWYDGVDEDCAGGDDDDQDGDGHTVPGAGGDDCHDDPTLDDGEPAARQAANVYGGAPDTWYDGADSDCDGRDDFDQDEDGYVPTAYVGVPTAFLPTGKGGDLPGGDCADEDPVRNPGEIEVIGDAIDSDCATSVDVDAFTVSPVADLSWNGIGSIEMGENASHLYASVVTEWFQDAAGSDTYNGDIVLELDAANPLAAPSSVDALVGSSTDAAGTTMTPTHGFFVDDTALYSAVARASAGSNPTLFIGGKDLSGAVIATNTTTDTNFIGAYDDIGVDVDASGMVYAFACSAAADETRYVAIEPDDLFASTDIKIDADWTGFAATQCEPEVRDVDGSGELVTLTGTTIEAQDFDPSSTAPTLDGETSYGGTAAAFDMLSSTEPWMAIASTTAQIVVLDTEGFDRAVTVDIPSAAVSLQGMVADGIAYVTWVDAAGAVGLFYGPPGEASTCFTSVYPIDVGGGVATSAAIWETSAGLLVLAVADADTLYVGRATTIDLCP